MAIKRTIKELCDRCGETQAILLPDGSVKVNHVCKNLMSDMRPPPYPYTYRPGEVIFEKAKLNNVDRLPL